MWRKAIYGLLKDEVAGQARYSGFSGTKISAKHILKAQEFVRQMKKQRKKLMK